MTPSREPEQHCGHECVCIRYDELQEWREVENGNPCNGEYMGHKCSHDTRRSPAPQQEPMGACRECEYSRAQPPAAPGADAVLDELDKTIWLLYEFCEWFCDYDCEEKPCLTTVSRLHERLEGIQKQMKDHPEYLEKWKTKRAEQAALRQQRGERKV